MELQKMKALIELSRTRNYSETAERLYTTQSNISKHIQSLEKELGVQLIDRSRRKIAMTKAGETVVRHAMKMMKIHDVMLQGLAAGSEQLQIACLPVMAHYGLTGLVSVFQKNHPQWVLVLNEIEDRDILEQVRQEQVEMAICRTESIKQDNKYEKLTLRLDRLVAVLPEKHCLANQTSVSLKRLYQEQFLQLSRTSSLYDTVVEACNQAGFKPIIRYTSRRMENLLAMVKEGDGISLMMERSVRYLPVSGLRVVPLDEDVISEIALVRIRKRKKSAGAKAFWVFARAWLAETEKG